MWALLIVMCLSSGECYSTAPMKFETKRDCLQELKFIRETKQIAKDNVSCQMDS